MSKLYNAKDLDAIADHFEQMAKEADNRAVCQRVQREKHKLQSRAETWRDAANFLRNCEITE